jgi:tetratricopeptide (TPR) repeat protein
MRLLYPTLASLVLLLVFVVIIGYQNRDMLRFRAYGEFTLRLMPLLILGAVLGGLPFILDIATVRDTVPVMAVYLGGGAILAALMARQVSPVERRATRAFMQGDYEEAARLYRQLVEARPIPRYYSALAACLDASGEHLLALEAADRAIDLDARLGIAYYNRASSYAALDDRERSENDLRTVFRADSERRLKQAAQEALEKMNKG